MAAANEPDGLDGLDLSRLPILPSATRTPSRTEDAVPIDSLAPHPANPRVGDVAAIVESIRTNGFYGHVIAQQSTRLILAGEHRWRAAKLCNLPTVPVVWLDVADRAALRILLVDNRTNDLSTYNDLALAKALERLANDAESLEDGLAGTGYRPEDFHKLVESLGDTWDERDQPQDEPDPATTAPGLAGDLAGGGDPLERARDPERGGDAFDATPTAPGAPTRCHLGDLWALGRHRLLCGDATDPDAVARLLSGVILDTVIADAPYGMRLDTDFSSMQNARAQANGMPSQGNTYASVIGDDQDFDAAPVRALWRAPEQFWFGADYYAHTLGDTEHSGAWLVWDKRLDESADRMFGSTFELIWSAHRHKRDTLRHKWAGIFGVSQETERRRVHPTQKPVVLIADLLERYAAPGAAIGDPFLGSGATVIAAERLGRTCYGTELAPAYCDVILRRWEAETGQVATLVGSVGPTLAMDTAADAQSDAQGDAPETLSAPNLGDTPMATAPGPTTATRRAPRRQTRPSSEPVATTSYTPRHRSTAAARAASGAKRATPPAAPAKPAKPSAPKKRRAQA